MTNYKITIIDRVNGYCTEAGFDRLHDVRISLRTIFSLFLLGDNSDEFSVVVYRESDIIQTFGCWDEWTQWHENGMKFALEV